MKYALCLYGQPRYLHEGFSYIKRHILDKYKPDVFIHVWDYSEQDYYAVSPWRKESFESKVHTPEEVKTLYNPTLMETEPPKNFFIPIDSISFLCSEFTAQLNASNILSQIYSRQKVVNLLESSKNNYDTVFFSRFDNVINSLPKKINKELIYFANTHENPQVFNDNFCIANKRNIVKIMSIEKNLPIFIESDPPINFNIEDFLTASIKYHKLLNKCVKTKKLSIDHISLLSNRTDIL